MKPGTSTALASFLLLAAGLGGCSASTPSPARSGAEAPAPAPPTTWTLEFDAAPPDGDPAKAGRPEGRCSLSRREGAVTLACGGPAVPIEPPPAEVVALIEGTDWPALAARAEPAETGRSQRMAIQLASGQIVVFRPSFGRLSAALDELVTSRTAQLHPAPAPPPAREVVPELPEVLDPGLVTLQVGGLRAPHAVETVRVGGDGTWTRTDGAGGEARVIRAGRLDAAALGALRELVAKAGSDVEVRMQPCDAMAETRLRVVLGARGVVSWASPCGGDVAPAVDEVVATLGRL